MPIEKFPYLYEKFGRNPKGLAAIELKKNENYFYRNLCQSKIPNKSKKGNKSQERKGR